jgi:SAM-dependent methyltransferase
MIKDNAFYDAESAKYSSKRYPERPSDFIQYFFTERLKVALRELRAASRGNKGLRLLEVGCADGVVLRSIAKGLPGTFASMVGIDTSEGMVASATKLTPGTVATFFVRGTEPRAEYDALVEIGVANYADFDTELTHASSVLSRDGTYVLSMAGNSSVSAKLGKSGGYRNFLSYGEYEKKIRTSFDLIRTIPVGLHIPLIWRIPILARAIQPVFETCCRPLFPNLYHEKVYVLKRKTA